MVKAVFQKGSVQLLESPPNTWSEGSSLGVNRTPPDNASWSDQPADVDEPAYLDNPTPEELEEWKREMNALCADNSEENHQIMMRTFAEIKAYEKDLMRKAMGL
jgi:hypothetical protein